MAQRSPRRRFQVSFLNMFDRAQQLGFEEVSLEFLTNAQLGKLMFGMLEKDWERLEIHERRLLDVEEKMRWLTPLLSSVADWAEWMRMPQDIEVPTALLPFEKRKSKMLAGADGIIDQIQENFEDLELRLDLVMKLKDEMRELWLLAREAGDKYLKQIVMMMHDSLKNLYAEELTRQQLESLRNILSIMMKKSLLDMQDAKRVHDDLLSVGLEYMPKIRAEV